MREKFQRFFCGVLEGDRSIGAGSMGWVEVEELLRCLGCTLVLSVALGGLPCNSWVFAFQSDGKVAKPPAMAIDINKATVNDLVKLPGIGPGLAKRIVAFREKNGPFKRIEDLMVIKGIGFKKWKEIRPYVRIAAR